VLQNLAYLIPPLTSLVHFSYYYLTIYYKSTKENYEKSTKKPVFDLLPFVSFVVYNKNIYNKKMTKKNAVLCCRSLFVDLRGNKTIYFGPRSDYFWN